MGPLYALPLRQLGVAQPTVICVSLAGDLCESGSLLQRCPLPWGVRDRSSLAALEQVLWLLQWWQEATGV